jgi:hypothetical protein
VLEPALPESLVSGFEVTGWLSAPSSCRVVDGGEAVELALVCPSSWPESSLAMVPVEDELPELGAIDVIALREASSPESSPDALTVPEPDGTPDAAPVPADAVGCESSASCCVGANDVPLEAPVLPLAVVDEECVAPSSPVSSVADCVGPAGVAGLEFDVRLVEPGAESVESPPTVAAVPASNWMLWAGTQSDLA